MMMLVLTIALLTACDKGGNHNFSEEWSSNETHHWHACADKGCKETKDKAEHSWSGGNVTVEPTTEQKGTMVSPARSATEKRQRRLTSLPLKKSIR